MQINADNNGESMNEAGKIIPMDQSGAVVVYLRQSPTIAKLAVALAKAQGVILGAAKDSENPFFKAKYADLASVWDACRGPLSSNGLSVCQTTDVLNDGKVILLTQLLHTSGEWIVGRYPVCPVKNDPQSLGSATTYARRYALMAIAGIAPEDDDGNAASGRPQTPHTAGKNAPLAAPNPVDKAKAQVAALKSTQASQTQNAPVGSTAPAHVLSPEDKQAIALAEYVIEVGKFKNTKLKDIPIDTLEQYITWFVTTGRDTNRVATGKWKEMSEKSQEYLLMVSEMDAPEEGQQPEAVVDDIPF
jgi:hypothetical protein